MPAVQSFIFSTSAASTQAYSEEPEPSYPERYIFLFIALAIIVKILRILHRHRMAHEFDGYMSRSDASDSGSIHTSSIPGYLSLPTDPSSIATRPGDDPYVAGISSLATRSSEVLPPPAYRAIASNHSRNGAFVPPPPYVQAPVPPPPPQPLNLPDSDLDRSPDSIHIDLNY